MMDIKSLRNVAVVSAVAFTLSACITAKEMTAPVDGDDDGDGVLNSMDECPNTPAGATVNAVGCEILMIAESTYFAFDSDKLTPQAKELIAALAPDLAGMSLVADGYADVVGAADYNVDLSTRRAQSVANELLQNGAADVLVVGHGSTSQFGPDHAKNRVVIVSTAGQ